MKLNVKDMEFIRGVPDVSFANNRDAGNVHRLHNIPGREYTVEDEGGWLKITGKNRSFWCSKANVAFMVVLDEPVVEAKRK